MFKRSIAVLALALAIAAPAFAVPGDMNVAEFLRRADALRARGIGALLSSDYRTLRREGEAAGEAYRQRLERERAQGSPSSCPPRGARPSNDRFLTHLRSYPVAVRPNTTLRTAMADYFIRNYPCAR